MSAITESAGLVAGRLRKSGGVTFDPVLIPVIEAALAALVTSIRQCYPTPSDGYLYLTRPFLLPIRERWRRERIDRAVSEAVADAWAQRAGAVKTGPNGVNPWDVADAVHETIRQDLSRGLMERLYAEGSDVHV